LSPLLKTHKRNYVMCHLVINHKGRTLIIVVNLPSNHYQTPGFAAYTQELTLASGDVW